MKLYALERIVPFIDLDDLDSGRRLFVGDCQLVNDLRFFLSLDLYGINCLRQLIACRCFDLLDIVLLTARLFISGERLAVAVGLWELINQI